MFEFSYPVGFFKKVREKHTLKLNHRTELPNRIFGRTLLVYSTHIFVSKSDTLFGYKNDLFMTDVEKLSPRGQFQTLDKQ